MTKDFLTIATRMMDAMPEDTEQVIRRKNMSSLARLLGVTPQALSNYKKRGEMPSTLILKFAERTGTSVDELVKGHTVECISNLVDGDTGVRKPCDCKGVSNV